MSRRRRARHQADQHPENAADGASAVHQGPTRFPWPPVILLTAGIAAYLLGEWVTPLSLLPSAYAPVLSAFGWLLVIGGLGLDIFALVTLRRNDTTISPIHGSAKLVTSGPYAISRNPIYLGNTLILIGLGFALNNFWFPVLAIVAAYAVTRLQILPEERHLAMRFGRAWRQYSKRVSRWF